LSGWVVGVNDQESNRLVSGLACAEVLRELSNYIDDAVAPGLRRNMEAHFRTCESCSATLESTRTVVHALGDERLIDVPKGYSERLHEKLRAQLDVLAVTPPISGAGIPLGITGGNVELGSHLIHFWESDEEFERGVRFLEPGLAGRDHCVVFGHDEVTSKVFRQLDARGFDSGSLLRDRRITLLRRENAAANTLSDIEDIFAAAVRAGAPAIRYLGNLDYGKVPLPGSGIDDVLELEARVTALARRYPAVVVCMYDVNTLPGKLILKGGFQTHPWAVCGDHLQPNPYYVPEAEFLTQLQQAH
jgi:MEDS: MEthanogen/methylotroph, DcmR Sensory domain/Putative zinc-finger